MAEMKTFDQWNNTLCACGVTANVSHTWSPIFETVITDTSFSRGVAELPDFLGNVIHESSVLTRLEESLNYTTPGRLMKVWPTRFPTLESETPYRGNPKALANKVYGSRMGNIDGDGWTYRGRGLIMITGRDNYAAIEAVTGFPIVSQPDLLLDKSIALSLAIAWWENRITDKYLGNKPRIRRLVNGGEIGLTDVTRISIRAAVSMGLPT